ncbi:MAG: molybdate ABC transporter substrate-binding protein [Firmicutes bacterium]|nr:molybdate ABC transporter substrate-binding protein [Bacillota bacterium]MBQ9604016.1 molybdate ABC transporter substrate-binding protein [Bacillota bacterium]
MKKSSLRKLFAMAAVICLTGCGSGAAETNNTAQSENTENTEVTVFIAASLNGAMQEIADEYKSAHPHVDILLNEDSSGTLMTQIEEGHKCDIFFSAAQKQMDTLEEEGYIKENTRKNVLENTLVLVTYKDSGTSVTGLENIGSAKSIALAGESVPAGKYTRTALKNLGLIGEETETADISAALGGIEISEQSNVSKTLTAVAEHSCEVGTVYYSDTYGYEDNIVIIEKVDKALTGDIVYPMARIKNDAADDKETEAANEFAEYITSSEAKPVFEKYLFEVSE